MQDALRTLMLSHDGPIPPRALAAARWGAGAWMRLARSADAALLEARLRDCGAALARIRILGFSDGAAADAIDRLVRNIARCRAAASSFA